MRIAVLGFAMLGVASSGLVTAYEDAAVYSLNPDQPVTGTLIPRSLVTGNGIPVDRPYSEMSPAQQSLVKARYDRMAASDEPPYPVNGLRSISNAIAHADVSATVEGELVMQVDVNANGDATSVTTVRSPNTRIARIAASALQREKYKPALCRGQPCAMPFVFHADLTQPR